MPIIERRLLPHRLGKVRKHSSWVPILAMVLVAVLMVGAIAGLMVQIANNGQLHRSATPVRISAGVLYTTHNPILINGNADFTLANGVSAGTGTASDPYIIENWDISAASATLISIQNTTAWFVVRNCSTHGAGSSYSGVQLLNCTNGMLVDNNCSTDSYGILLRSSTNNILDNNNCSSERGGIFLNMSNNNTLIDNTCSSDINGIALVMSNNNTLIDNNCTPIDLSGMFFASSNNNTVTNNNCSGNMERGIVLDVACNNTLSNNSCCSLDFFGDGIDLWPSSNNNTLSYNNCSLNSNYGIHIDLSSGNVMIGNQLRDNSLYGICIDTGSSSNMVSDNFFIGNNGATDTYDASHVQACDNGTNDWWNTSDTPHGYGNHWSDWTTPDANHDGIVDQPYAIDGSAGAKDYYPQTTVQTQIPEFGMMPFVAMALMGAIVLTGETRRRKKS